MRHLHLSLVLLITLAKLTFQHENDIDGDDEPNPLGEIAASILKEQSVRNIGSSLVQGLLQSNTANALGKIASKLGTKSSEEIMEGLVGAWMENQKAKKEGKQGEFDRLFQNIGNLVKRFQPEEGADEGGLDAGAVLQGLGTLGSLLGNQQGGGGGIDPNLLGSLGSLVSAFSQTQQQQDKPSKHKKAPRIKEKSRGGDEEMDLSGLLGLVGSFVGQGGQGGGGGLLQFLPMIQQTLNAFTGSEARKREDSHSEHADKLPPVLERVHVAFDHFVHSDVGRHVISAVGAEKAFNFFRDENGTFDYQKFNEMMENKSFRRHWIRVVVDRLIGFLQYLTQPKVYKEYFVTGQLLANGYLKSQGFPKSTLFDSKRPVETLSAFINYVAKKYFDIKINSEQYVQPVVIYVQELLVLSEKKGPLGDEYKELGAKLADTLNVEIIEPLARVNRAYKYSKSVPKCTRYLLCLVNSEVENEVEESMPGVKKILNKGASLVAGWYLSSDTDVSFWSLYGDIIDPPNCKALYQPECDGFHEEELRVTTEYNHTEL